MQFSAWTWVSINTPLRRVNEEEERFKDLVVQHAVFKGVLKIEKEAPVWFEEIYRTTSSNHWRVDDSLGGANRTRNAGLN
ncbi:hypothetical protein D9757_010060 [Collybiopsis confluens]|uniref:Uncharacterized protein n=1 Tax=Collybiopsis confluens TaxID=2823264 RepID=A0A8H5LY97_9AGAR|nr:hypothetical protein D9757_010060 [Collybiopsis confluens]